MRKIQKIGFALGLSLMLSTSVSAQPFDKAINFVLKNHPRIQAAKADESAALENEKVAVGEWYPELNISGHYGYERINKELARDTGLPTREVEVSLTQPLWDFGVINTRIDEAELTVQQQAYVHEATRQEIMLEAVRAYVDLRRLYRIKAFASQSVENIKKITKLESIRVEKGQGYSTDVLQAKTQLAAAQARLVQVNGALDRAKNRYKAVFNDAEINPANMDDVVAPQKNLPKTLNRAIDLALENNPELKVASLVTSILDKKAEGVEKDSFKPKFEIELSGGLSEDTDGALTGHRTEYKAMVQFRMPINSGLTERNRMASARHSSSAANLRFQETRDLIVEEVSQAWQTMETAKINAEFLDRQADLAQEFLNLSRQERQLGRRSLLDILSGETALINAQSDSMSAHVEVVIAGYKLLKAIGHINK